MKANYFNLLILLCVGVPFVMGVVSVTNSMYTLNMAALPAYANTSAPLTTTGAPATTTTSTTTTIPSTSTTSTTTAAPSTTLAPVAASRAILLTRYHHQQSDVNYHEHQQRTFDAQDLPLITQTFTIECPMFGNCSRSGAGVATDSTIGTLEAVAGAFGCTKTSVNLARAFCLIELIVAVLATAAAAGAAQETSCAERFAVRVVILVGSAATLVFSLISVILISLLRQCLTTQVDHIELLVVFFSPRPATSNVDSIAFPVYICAMSFAAVALVLCIVWILGIAGPEAVDRTADEEEAKKKEKEMQSKLIDSDDDDDGDVGTSRALSTVDVLGSGTEKVASPFNHAGNSEDDDVLQLATGVNQQQRESTLFGEGLDVDDLLGDMGGHSRRES